VPAGQLLSGITTLLFGFKPVPKETGFGVGERGLEKGCAMPDEVAAGVPAVRGDAVEDEDLGGEVVNLRVREGRGRQERRQRAQIMVDVLWLRNEDV
jgi:hypothetical protein